MNWFYLIIIERLLVMAGFISAGLPHAMPLLKVAMAEQEKSKKQSAPVVEKTVSNEDKKKAHNKRYKKRNRVQHSTADDTPKGQAFNRKDRGYS